MPRCQKKYAHYFQTLRYNDFYGVDRTEECCSKYREKFQVIILFTIIYVVSVTTYFGYVSFSAELSLAVSLNHRTKYKPTRLIIFEYENTDWLLQGKPSINRGSSVLSFLTTQQIFSFNIMVPHLFFRALYAGLTFTFLNNAKYINI